MKLFQPDLTESITDPLDLSPVEAGVVSPVLAGLLVVVVLLLLVGVVGVVSA